MNLEQLLHWIFCSDPHDVPNTRNRKRTTVSNTIPLSNLRVQAKLKEDAFATNVAGNQSDVHFEVEIPYRESLQKHRAKIAVHGDCDCVARVLDALKKGKSIELVLGAVDAANGPVDWVRIERTDYKISTLEKA